MIKPWLNPPFYQPSLPAVAAAGPVVSHSKHLWRHTSFLSCTSVMHQGSTVQPVYTCVPFTCSNCVIAPPPLSFCSPVGDHLFWSSQTDSHSLSSVVNRKCSSWRITSHSSPLPSILTAPDLALVFIGRTFSCLASIICYTHCKSLCITAPAKCGKC